MSKLGIFLFTILLGLFFAQVVTAQAILQLDEAQTIKLQSNLTQKFGISVADARLSAGVLQSNLRYLSNVHQASSQKGLSGILQEGETKKEVIADIAEFDPCWLPILTTAQLVAVGGINHPTVQNFVLYSALYDMAIVFQIGIVSNIMKVSFVDGERFINSDRIPVYQQGWIRKNAPDDNIKELQKRLYDVAEQAEKLFPIYSSQAMTSLPPELNVVNNLGDGMLLCARSNQFNKDFKLLLRNSEYKAQADRLTAWMNYIFAGNAVLLSQIGIKPDRYFSSWIEKFPAEERMKMGVVYIQEQSDKFWILAQYYPYPNIVMIADAGKYPAMPIMAFNAFKLYDPEKILRGLQAIIH